MIDPNARLRRNPKVVHREVSEGRGTVLLHLDSGASYAINDTGSLIWSLLSEPIALAALLDDLNAVVVDPPTDLVEELTRFLEALRERELVLFDSE